MEKRHKYKLSDKKKENCKKHYFKIINANRYWGKKLH